MVIAFEILDREFGLKNNLREIQKKNHFYLETIWWLVPWIVVICNGYLFDKDIHEDVVQKYFIAFGKTNKSILKTLESYLYAMVAQ